MCGTENPRDAQTCKFCGYIFENFDSGQIDTSTKRPVPPPNPVPEAQNVDANFNAGSRETFPDYAASSSTAPITTVGSGTPAFVVSKSLWSSILPSLAYLVFILVFTTSAGISLYSLAVFLFFIAIAVLPVLFSPRKFEFYDDQLEVHKTIGGDTLIPYSDLIYNNMQRGSRSQIVLSSTSRRMRPLVVPGNPTNKDLGMDLNQFLAKRVKKSGGQNPPAKDDNNPVDSESLPDNNPPTPDSSGGFNSSQGTQ